MKDSPALIKHLNDKEATAAFAKLKTALATEVGLATLDYTAATDSSSGRPCARPS